MIKEKNVIEAYEMAKERYASLGVDTEKAMEQLQKIALSLHCWQTDDVSGFENQGGELTGGIQVTGNYPGRARNIDEVRADILKASSLIPGKHRLNLHAIYGDFEGKVVDRDEIEPCHFKSWMDWAKENDMKLDFNSTSFSHPKSGNFTLSNPASVRVLITSKDSDSSWTTLGVSTDILEASLAALCDSFEYKLKFLS